MTYVDCNGNQFEDYEAACWHYGADTPAMLRAEMHGLHLEDIDRDMDDMEARGGPAPLYLDPWADEILF